MSIKWTFLAVVALMTVFLPPEAGAEYRAESDTGTGIFDYIENERRMKRLNAYTPEQEKLVEDSKELGKHLRRPVDPAAIPVAFEGDDLTYDQTTGEFVAKGKVEIISLDKRRFSSEEADGNTIEQRVHIPGKAHMLQLTDKMPRVTMDGYETHYNYGTSTGTMEKAVGKVDHEYISGKRIEFYPDKVVAYDGTMTRCGAKKPDYHMSAEKIELWPKDRYVMHNVKFWLKGAVLYSRKRYEQKIEEDENKTYPRIGYNKDDGAWISYDYQKPLIPNVSWDSHLFMSSKKGGRSNSKIYWNNAGSHYEVTYGYYEDSDQDWIKKRPSFIYRYEHPIKGTHLNYGLEAEYGRWVGEKSKIKSNHQFYKLSLWRNPIIFHRWLLFLYTAYSLTKESYDHSTVDGFNYAAVLGKEFDERTAAYVGYYYTKNNSENSLFDFDLDSYSRKVQSGISYRLTNNDRVVAGIACDVGSGKIEDVDYYWYHDLHCSQIIMRYRAKRSQYQFQWQFTPW